MRDCGHAADQLRQEGIALLPRAFPVDLLAQLQAAAEETGQRCFAPHSYSISLQALREFINLDPAEPFRAAAIDGLLTTAMGEPVQCGLAQSWLRKRFAPPNAPRHYQPNSWHQDGGLGVDYSSASQSPGPMTRLITCWVPLRNCGRSSPGLELVRQRLDRLLPFQDLVDPGLRQRFSPESFWTPELELGDALVFHADILHRTHVLPGMRQDRISIEYRFFPQGRG